jgi:hypothetical protein
LNAEDFAQLLTHVGELLEALSIPHAIVGSVASSRFGVQRATMDIDVVADLNSGQVAAFVRAFKPDFYIDEELVLEALEHRSSFNALHLETGTKFDFFTPKNRAYDQVALNRRTRDVPPFMMPEDVLLGKLEWYRAGDEISDRQWNDILGILRASSRFDLEYTRRWASTLGVADLLERAVRESETIS